MVYLKKRKRAVISREISFRPYYIITANTEIITDGITCALILYCRHVGMHSPYLKLMQWYPLSLWGDSTIPP